jgi:HK97 family phage major capsid protein
MSLKMTLAQRNRVIFEAMKKGDIGIQDLIDDGGYLPTEEEKKFTQKVYQSTRMLGLVRTVDMTGPKRRINKIGITGNFLHKAPASGTALDAAKRSKVFTEYVELTTEKLLGSMYIPYEVIEDNIEKDLLENTIMDQILPPKVSRDLEKLLIQGDTDSADTLLSAANGILKLLATGSNVLALGDITGLVNDELFEAVLEYLPDEYRENEDMLRYFVHRRVGDAYRKFRRLRLTGEGDQVRLENHLLDQNWAGIPILNTPQMPVDDGVLTYPNNLILGVQRGIMFETARDIEAQMIVIVVSARVAVGIEEKEACVKVTGLNAAATSSTSTA